MKQHKKNIKKRIKTIIKYIYSMKLLKKMKKQNKTKQKIIWILVILVWIIILPTPLPWLLVILVWIWIIFSKKTLKRKIIYLYFKLRINKVYKRLKMSKIL